MGPHNFWVTPSHNLGVNEEFLRANPVEQRNVTLVVSSHAFLHLIAGGAVNDGNKETEQLLLDNVGPSVRKFLSSGICPDCLPTAGTR
jgi:hypothetical protein